MTLNNDARLQSKGAWLTQGPSKPNASYCKFIFTFLLSRNHFNMGIGEEEVKVDWDVRSKIFQDGLLLTEMTQKGVLFLRAFSHVGLKRRPSLSCTFQGGLSSQLCRGCTGGFPGASIWECAGLQSSAVGKYNHWLSLGF